MLEPVKRTILTPPVSMELFGRRPARFDILSKRLPQLADAGGLDEPEAADEIVELLVAMNAQVGEFRAGLELFNHAEARAGFARNWGPIACRDAGAALFDFRDALKQMVAALAERRSLRRARAGLRSVEKRFAAAFPTARARRDGTVPGSEGPDAPVPRPHDDMCDAAILANVARAGRCVTHARDGRAIRFELSERSLWTLVGLRNDAFGAFEEAS